MGLVYPDMISQEMLHFFFFNVDSWFLKIILVQIEIKQTSYKSQAQWCEFAHHFTTQISIWRPGGGYVEDNEASTGRSKT